MGCISSAPETITCPNCKTKTELREQLFDSDVEADQKFNLFQTCKKCGQGLATDGCLWSKPTPESFETEMVIDLTDATLKQFVPSNPYDTPCKGFKLFFKVSGKTHGLWLPKSNLVEGTKLYVAVDKPPPTGPASVGEAAAGLILTAVLMPEDLLPSPLPASVEQRIDAMIKHLPGVKEYEQRLDAMLKVIEEKGCEWGGYEEEQKHKKARVMRWDPPRPGAYVGA
mmetsp:Transcript_35334/g.65892  ORF Transcript_35334/g.65892 Transcript_35334/m.65892 type:complete len:226 (-) Transcript_35334:159-836(-)